MQGVASSWVCVCVCVCYSTSHLSNVCSSQKRYHLPNSVMLNAHAQHSTAQCLWLAGTHSAPIVHQCLTNPDSAISLVNENRNNILRQDWAKPHTSLKHVVSNEDIWSRVWDTALDRGCSGTKLSQCLFKTLCWPLFGDRKCQYCTTQVPLNQTFFQHLCCCHLDFDLSTLTSVMDSCDNEFF